MDRAAATKATKAGAIAALISGIITTVIFLGAFLSNAQGDFAYFNDPWIIIDIVLVFALAYFIFKNSRVAAVVMFFYFLLSKLVLGIELNNVASIPVSLAFLYFFGQAVRGAFAFHKIEKAENPNYSSPKKWVIISGSIVAAVLFILVGIGLLAPPVGVVAGEELAERFKKKLVSAEIIGENETISYFYTPAIMDVSAEGTLITDERIILYMPDENGAVSVYYLDLKDVRNIHEIQKGSFVDDSVYRIETDEAEKWMQVPLSVDSDGHLLFVKDVEQVIAANKSNESDPSIQTE